MQLLMKSAAGPGRRSEYPADPDLFEAVVKALGLESVGQRLLQALRLLR